MDVIVLVGGQGTRLRPLTARRHKSLLPVCNRPAFDYLLDWVQRAGFDRAVLALGRHNEDLAAACVPGAGGGVRVEPVFESEPLGSGGAIRHAVREAGVRGRFAVLNGDLYFELDFAAALAAHAGSGAELTIALHEEDEVSQFGVATVDGRSFITRFVEKSPEPPSRLVNAGLWIFEPGLVDEIPGGPVRVEETLFPGLVAAGRKVFGHRFEGPWFDIGTPARYLALNLALLDRLGGPALGDAATIAAGATVVRSALGPGTAVGPGAAIEDSVAWEGVRIGARARLAGSVVADGAVIGEDATLEGAVIGPGAIIGAGLRLPPGTVIAEDAQVGGVP